MLWVIGINHKTAPLIIREHLAFLPDNYLAILQSLLKLPGVQEVLILSTCNRTEIYSKVQDIQIIIQWWQEEYLKGAVDLASYIYFYSEQEMVMHLLRVACGIDSFIIGEAEILGQIKKAYFLAHKYKASGVYLNRLFQLALNLTKSLRNNSKIGSHAISIAYLAICLARRIFSNFRNTRVLLIGAGDIINHIAQYLYAQEVKQLYFVNRTTQKALNLAKKYQASYVDFMQFSQVLPKMDIIFSAVSATIPVISKELIEHTLKLKRKRLMLFIDLGIPRNIEPQAQLLEEIYLYTIDDLKELSIKNEKQRQAAAYQMEEMILIESSRIMRALKSIDYYPLIRAYHLNAEKMRKEVLVKASKMIKKNISAERVIEYATQLLMHKLLHVPTVRLKNMAYQQGENEFLNKVKDLLDISYENDETLYTE